MPQIMIDLTDDELAFLRAEAAERGTTAERWAHDVLVASLARRRQIRRSLEGAVQAALVYKATRMHKAALTRGFPALTS
ncbi:hypothetical protein [Streptomyces sp. NPDC003077]|uniref:hypothetical protein n=1 Tax=Streptomyces sp. NPDC003077 TaxID=3154443 RepID=UPI0033B870AB